jgi:hypothetical protein
LHEGTKCNSATFKDQQKLTEDAGTAMLVCANSTLHTLAPPTVAHAAHTCQPLVMSHNSAYAILHGSSESDMKLETLSIQHQNDDCGANAKEA